MTDFTYEVPPNLKEKIISFLQQNGNQSIARLVQRCTIEYTDLGLAFYAGMRGDNWNKHALDFMIEGPKDAVNALKSKHHTKTLKDAIEKMLKPNTSGFLVRNLEYNLASGELEIVLPDEQGETFETLTGDIYDALRKNEPALVLDRLHTYSAKFLREICTKHNISITDSSSGKHHSLHSLMGMLVNYYSANKIFDSEFTHQALKMTISLFERFNAIRNEQSYAHDNDVLNNTEATYVVSIMTATLRLINEVEKETIIF